jgi:glycosyltransferase involved in cell wall biosynthesis
VQSENPLVSIIIPCFNYGRYLPEAFESIFSQSYPNIEIILIDDGSTDNTRQIVERYSNVKYFYQTNQGLSAARNAGIEKSSGDFLVFLDADDLLLPDAITTNLSHLKQNEAFAFVSGAHERMYAEDGRIEEVFQEIKPDHYNHLLFGNYIAMHASVMYRRWIFDSVLYDISLNACEDYHLYLKIARNFPVGQHNTKIASYRIHDLNMSKDYELMLATGLRVLKSQKKYLRNREELYALKHGKNGFKAYYYREIYEELIAKIGAVEKKDVFQILRAFPKLTFVKFRILQPQILQSIKLFIKRNAPESILRRVHDVGLYQNFSPPVGKINLGDFSRTTPFSRDFGYSRGGPVDRFYIETFLSKQSKSIKGRVLEIGDNNYTLRFGGSKVERSDVLHINSENPHATFVGDLSNAPQLPTGKFDCIILTQTLQLIYHFKEALETCYRVLRPGGTLLITVPGISQIDSGEWNEYWYWSFTKLSITRLLSEIFPTESVEVRNYGNVLAATAFLHGIGLPELQPKQIESTDPNYQVIISAVAVKPTGNQF